MYLGRIKHYSMIAVSIYGSFLLQSCGRVQSQKVTNFKIDGSSTVFPVSNLIAEEFKKEEQTGIKVSFSGTLEGFEKFCKGETDITNASVPIPKLAMKQCKDNQIPYIEIPIGFDPLTVVVNNKNTWVKNLTIEQLKTMWQPTAEGKLTKWNQVNPDWPDASLNLFGPGRESGTSFYFFSVVVGEAGKSRQDYSENEEDEAIAKRIIQDENALGYFGHSEYEKNKNNLKAVPIVNASGVERMPSIENSQNGTYNPFSRPLFIYVNAKKAQDNKALRNFVRFYLKKAPMAVANVGYLPLPESAYRQNLIHFEANQVGTVFNGSPITTLTFNELLTQDYAKEGKPGYNY